MSNAPGPIRETLKILDSLDLSKEGREKIYCKNLKRVTGKKLVKA